MSVVQAERPTEQYTGPARFSRRNLLWAYGGLVSIALALDFSIYVGHVAHIYVHDITAVVVGVLGVMLAIRSRAVVVGGRWFLVPLGLFVFLLASTILIGAARYGGVPVDMHKLFWFEHGDAVRIVGELFVFVWTFGQLRPNRQETWAILDIVVWGAALAVGLTVVQAIVTDTPHATTTEFDVDILAGLPLAVVFAVSKRPRSADLVRLVVFGAGASLLYSRATMLSIGFTTVAVLVATRNWRKVGTVVASIVAGWLIVLAVSLILFGSILGAGTFTRAASMGNQQLAAYTIPNRVAIWRDALHISRISPIVGVGYHDYFRYSSVSEIKNGSQQNPTDLFSTRIKSAHDDYLSWLAETGIIGLAVFLAFWGSALTRSIRFAVRSVGDERLHYVYAAAFIVGILGISVFGEVLVPRVPEGVPTATVWWIVLASLFIEEVAAGSVIRPRPKIGANGFD